jgi:hypothetical protein
MIPVSAVCVFCEDLREDKSGQDIIIGTLPDNLVGQASLAFLPRIGAYLRVHLDVERDIPKEISAKLLTTDGQLVAETMWDRSVVDKAFADSKTNHMPIVGLIFKVVVAPFPISTEGGKITALVIIDGVEYLAGAVNIVVPTA